MRKMLLKKKQKRPCRCAGRRGDGQWLTDQRHGPDPGHVPPGVEQTAARRGGVSARLAGKPASWPPPCAGPPAACCCTTIRSNTATPWVTRPCARCWRTDWAAIHIPVTTRQIITTVGATHALDIVSRTSLKAGDPVMVEEPGWSVEFARLAALGMRILPVPRRADGPDLEVMARVLRSPRAQAVCECECVPQPHGLLSHSRPRAPRAATGPAAQLPHC